VVPVIETARLRLREVRGSDFDAHAAMLGDPAVTRFIGGQPLSREESWRKMLACAGLWGLLGYGYWTVERLEDGAYLGQAGFADFKRDMVPSIKGIPEMGWIFASHTHGHGYATEAVLAGLKWAREALGPREIVAIIDPRNAPSIRLAQKLGFLGGEEARYKGEPILLYRRAAVLLA
jgi:RimJ/RimL family protein N-acetyltransferase